MNASYLIHESNDAVAKQVQTKLNGYDMVECIDLSKNADNFYRNKSDKIGLMHELDFQRNIQEI